MRKAQKKQVEEFLPILEEAHNEIKQCIDRKDSEGALTLLAQCQEGAVQLGNLIEDIEGEDFITIGLIEDYCELIYELYNEIEQMGVEQSRGAHKVMRKSLVRIENSIKNDIKVRVEAVFLPYQASMWDSLESVWKEAEADPNCDAYVIPIPYYDKDKKGNFIREHYEGELYPDYVPITPYDDFDFGAHHPDMIFIHNPYDGDNYITSVPPFFFSENLKKYTDNLVYIPYFILCEVLPDHAKGVKMIKSSCILPAVVHANRVIVQSETMRQIYINVLVEHAGERVREHFEKRIFGIGSPKVDKAMNTKISDVNILEEWEKVMQQSDGGRKKIILYNTSIAAFLQNSEKMLDKIQEALTIFKSNQSSVALLWRPHPLMKATVESMCPHLLERYKKIIENYQSEGWGIYDESADFNRAMVLSDAYYGDGSSVVQLYRKMGKYVMIQCCESEEEGVTISGSPEESELEAYIKERGTVIEKVVSLEQYIQKVPPNTSLHIEEGDCGRKIWDKTKEWLT